MVGAVSGVRDLIVEQQTIIPQLRIELDRDQLLLNGLNAADVNEFIETAMSGQVVSEILQGQRTRSISCCGSRTTPRENLEVLRRLSIDLAEGARSAGVDCPDLHLTRRPELD